MSMERGYETLQYMLLVCERHAKVEGDIII